MDAWGSTQEVKNKKKNRVAFLPYVSCDYKNMQRRAGRELKEALGAVGMVPQHLPHSVGINDLITFPPSCLAAVVVQQDQYLPWGVT